MEKPTRNSARTESLSQLAAGYETSGLTRHQYSQQTGIPVTTLDYYRLRHRRQAKTKSPQLVPVTITPQTLPAATSVILILTNGRRIETSWSFPEAGLTQLLRIAEQA